MPIYLARKDFIFLSVALSAWQSPCTMRVSVSRTRGRICWPLQESAGLTLDSIRSQGKFSRASPCSQLSLCVLLGAVDVLLHLLLFGIVGIQLEQLLPGFDRALRIELPLPAHDAEIE